MKNNEFLNSFENETEVPKIVDEKCMEAYEMIYKDSEQTSKPKKRVTFKAGMALAACVAVVSVGVVALPAMAEYIPALQSAYEFISGNTYTKDPAEKIDLTKYAEPVNINKEEVNADIVMQNVYCDGSNISVSLALTPKSDILKNLTAIGGNIVVTLDGECLNKDNMVDGAGFTAGDDGNYYTILHYSNLNISENSVLKININSIYGINGYVWNWVANDDYSGTYIPEHTDVVDGKFEFEHKLKIDESHNKTYIVNETQGNVTIESVTVTPFMTTLVMNGLEEKQNFRVLDQDGNELDWMGLEGSISFSSPLTTAKELIIEIVRLDEDDFPTEYSFNVPIDEGFANKYDVEYNIDESKITYNPPMEELDRIAEEKFKAEYDEVKKNVTALPLNTQFHLYDSMYGKITGSEIDEISGYEISDEHYAWYENMYGEGSFEKSKMLLVTYEVENMSNLDCEYYFWGLDMMAKDFDPVSWVGEPDYRSVQDHGGKDGNIYDFAPNETRTITLGYFVPEEVLNKGYYAENGANYVASIWAKDLLSGKAHLYEIN